MEGLQSALNNKANSSDVYTKQQTYTQTEVDNLLSDKADSDDVYTKTETDTLLGGKANTSHGHAISDVSGLQDALDNKASSVHTHTIANITGLQDALDNKANSTHSHAISDITNLQSTLNAKAEKTEIKTYTVTEDLVTVTTDSTKGVAPYNTSY